MAIGRIELKSIESSLVDVGVLHDVHFTFSATGGHGVLVLQVQFFDELKAMKWEALTAHLLGLAAEALNVR